MTLAVIEARSNVISLDEARKSIIARAATESGVYFSLQTLALPDHEIREGMVVAVAVADATRAFITRYEGRTGRDMHGRFVRKGDPKEAYRLDCGMLYTDDDVRKGSVTILGKVMPCWVSICRDRPAPPRGAA